MKPDLTKGELLIGDVLVTPNVNEDALFNSDVFKTSDEKGSRFVIFDSINDTDINGQMFTVEAYFTKGKLYKIILKPTNLEMPNPGYPDEKYQAVRRAACDKWLIDAFGYKGEIKENERESSMKYSFDWGCIYSASTFWGRNEFSAGKIYIRVSEGCNHE